MLTYYDGSIFKSDRRGIYLHLDLTDGLIKLCKTVIQIFQTLWFHYVNTRNIGMDGCCT